jgi:hypothetical protein
MSASRYWFPLYGPAGYGFIDMNTNDLNLLKLKTSKNRMETAILSESVLAKDWLSPEEDEAWKNL